MFETCVGYSRPSGEGWRATKAWPVTLALVLLIAGCARSVADATPLPSPSPIQSVQATPSVLVPPLPPTATATSTPVAQAPARPDLLRDYPSAIANYLTSVRGNADRLSDLFASWQLPSKDGFTLEWADADGDDEKELLVAMRALAKFPSSEEPRPFPVTILILLDPRTSGWQGHLLFPHDEADAGPYALPQILTVRDVNADRAPEVVFVSQTCGAHTCFEHVHFVQWDGADYRSLTAKPPGMAFADVSLSDLDGDGVSEMVMTGGTYGSVGAGLQRARTEVYRWNGRTYALAKTTYAASEYLYHKVMDGEAALSVRDYPGALAAYEQALSDHSLKAWKGGPDSDEARAERRDLRAFARYRTALIYALQGDRASLEKAVAESQRLDAGHPLAGLSRQLLTAYAAKGDMQQACNRLIEFAEAHAEVLAAMDGYGYANKGYQPEDICPVPAP